MYGIQRLDYVNFVISHVNISGIQAAIAVYVRKRVHTLGMATERVRLVVITVVMCGQMEYVLFVR